VEVLSEETLKVLETESVKNIRLVGRNVAGPLRILERYAQGLARGDSTVPVSVLLTGPPSSGKSILARILAARAGVSAFEMISPKDQYVGGTERKSRLQQRLLREWVPAIAFVDEVTENLPLERRDFDGDSGATRAVTASLLTMLSDESLRGRTLVLGTTNCPWRCGDAMKTRMRFLAVLHPLPGDFAEIIAVTAVHVDPQWRVNATSEQVRQAAEIFYNKGAGPRHIRAALSDVRLCGSPTEDAILAAARNLQLVSSWAAIEYADLWALRVTSFATDLPWIGDLDYPFPKHIAAVVDTQTGAIDHVKLVRRIEELRPHANM
jgi:AAA+ superfamily predicted ATPase